MSVTLIGIDCAADESKMGLALGVLSSEGVVRVERATLGTAGESAVATVASWIGRSGRFVLALDAPLGWPVALTRVLRGHRAGEAFQKPAQAVLRRNTEQAVAELCGRLPKEVGADRIARMAVCALDTLAHVRAAAQRPVPMAWCQGEDSGVIEVHPGSTLRAYGLAVGAYRGQSIKARACRRDVVKALAGWVELGSRRELLVDDPHLLDAAISVLAAADFARAACMPPADPGLAQREGWIWVRAKRA